MSAEGGRPAITPETKVGDLLAAYPELEEVLVGLSPAYKALRNPVLRRTVGKVATLRQVAKVGDVPVGTLVTRLRCAAGQSGEDAPETDRDAEERPEWADAERAARTWDARPAIEEGGHPMQQVMRDLAELPKGQVYQLLTPFVPAPLVELARDKGFAAFSAREGPELVRTFFRQIPAR